MRATRKSSVHGIRRRSPTNTLGFKDRRSTELTVKTASNSRGEPFDYWLATFRVSEHDWHSSDERQESAAKQESRLRTSY